MQTLLLIRHAVAEDRETWQGDDDAQRPLTKAGRRQARRIAGIVRKMIEDLDDAGRGIVALRSSPVLRCVDTIAPLAKKVGVPIKIDAGLMEGREIKPPSPREAGVHILSAHGDNIPWLLQKLRVDWDGRCKKGSIWLIGRDARGRVMRAEYKAVAKD
jgi:broad specificity phosphatase PhoE